MLPSPSLPSRTSQTLPACCGKGQLAQTGLPVWNGNTLTRPHAPAVSPTACGLMRRNTEVWIDRNCSESPKKTQATYSSIPSEIHLQLALQPASRKCWLAQEKRVARSNHCGLFPCLRSRLPPDFPWRICLSGCISNAHMDNRRGNLHRSRRCRDGCLHSNRHHER